LAVRILEHIRSGALEYAEPPAAEAGGVLAEGHAAPARLHAAQIDLLVLQEAVEDADRVRAAADTGDHHIGQPSGRIEDLRAGLTADHALEIAHHGRVGVRAER